MKTSELLKSYLKSRGIKQSAVAANIGMNNKTFNAILNGRAELRADVLGEVCRFIGVSPAIFFTCEVQDNGIKEA